MSDEASATSVEDAGINQPNITQTWDELTKDQREALLSLCTPPSQKNKRLRADSPDDNNTGNLAAQLAQLLKPMIVSTISEILPKYVTEISNQVSEKLEEKLKTLSENQQKNRKDLVSTAIQAELRRLTD